MLTTSPVHLAAATVVVIVAKHQAPENISHQAPSVCNNSNTRFQ